MWSRVKSWFGFTDWRDAEFERERDALLAHAPIPVFGMLGKTGSGKSSIVRYLTGATAAEIGNGFRPQTPSPRSSTSPTAGNRS